MKVQKRKLMRIFLVPLLLVVLFQGIMPFFMLMSSGVKDTMESNAVNLDSYLLKNREVMLENAMVEQWSSIRKESTYLNLEMSEFLRENAVDIKAFSARRDLQKNYAQRVFPRLLEFLHRDSTSGVFLIVANDTPLEKEGDYDGFFIRDSDPVTKTETNSDLLFERGIKNWPVEAGSLLTAPGFRFLILKDRGTGPAMISFMSHIQLQ